MKVKISWKELLETEEVKKILLIKQPDNSFQVIINDNYINNIDRQIIYYPDTNTVEGKII